MKASQSVIDALQTSLELHWSAIEVYRCQSEHFFRLGYKTLAKEYADDTIEEGDHASKLIGRLEELDAIPECEHECIEWPRMPDIVALLQSNLSLEQEAASAERDGIKVARQDGDEITAEVFEENLKGSNKSIVELEAALRQIEVEGVGQWLSTKR